LAYPFKIYDYPLLIYLHTISFKNDSKWDAWFQEFLHHNFWTNQNKCAFFKNWFTIGNVHKWRLTFFSQLWLYLRTLLCAIKSDFGGYFGPPYLPLNWNLSKDIVWNRSSQKELHGFHLTWRRYSEHFKVDKREGFFKVLFIIFWKVSFQT
jgi:hypothetical protein